MFENGTTNIMIIKPNTFKLTKNLSVKVCLYRTRPRTRLGDGEIATQWLYLSRCYIRDEPSATPRLIWPVRDLHSRPPGHKDECVYCFATIKLKYYAWELRQV